jgi:guanylate kinase
MSHYKEYDFIIVNDDFDTALADLRAIIRSQRLTCASQIHAQNDMLNDLLAGQLS